jgi:flagellar hook-associated protein 3 FlgL
MQPISTSANWNNALLYLDQAESAQNTDELQVSSGEVSQTLGGYGETAQSITSMEATQTQLQGFISSGNAVTNNLTAQATALTQVANGGSGALSAVDQAISSGSGQGLMQTLQTEYQQVVGGLNSQNNGVYIFGGGSTQAPVSATTLTSLSALASPSAAFQNGQFVSSAQIDQTTTIQTGMLASDVGTSLLTVFQNIAAYDAGPNGPLSGTLTTAQTDFLESQVTALTNANTTVTDYQAQNGEAQKTVTNTITDQQNQATTLQNLIGDSTDVNMATALSNLSQAQTAVSASAQVLASLQSDSLLKYLPA